MAHWGMVNDEYRRAWSETGEPSYDSRKEERFEHTGRELDEDGDGGMPFPSLTRLGELIMLYGDACSAPSTVGGAASQLPDAPGLEFGGIGLVRISVADDAQAAKNVSVAREAPFGRKFETLHDPTVRKTWEIDPGKIRFTNPDRDAGIAALIKDIATHFVKHRDMAEFQSHTLKLVTSGYRLALIDLLCWPVCQSMLMVSHQIKARIAQQLASLAHADWYGMLKGADKMRFQLLQSANDMLSLKDQ
ncbi:hypothetical protein GGF31_005666 [Allomyces arbusculus]|nr:hypothetical protein GGF31_005666 [Allomyces arbusculus]